MSITHIRHARIITMDDSFTVLEGDILIEDDRIIALGDITKYPKPFKADIVIDATDCLVMPGIIQSHMHLTQTLFRGLADELELMPWLTTRTWPLEGAHNHESNAISARLAAAELLRYGVTAVIDMGTSHHQDAIFETMHEVGLRGLFGKCLLDEGDDIPKTLLEDTESALASTEALIKRWHMTDNGRLRYAVAPRFVPSCSTKLLERSRDMARANGLRIHTHASENRGELAIVREKTGKGNIEYLKEIGYLGEDVILAHCIWLDADDRKMLADSGTHAVHCPSSNTKLASGIANLVAMREAGCRIALGLDGAHNHMNAFFEMRLAAYLQKVSTLSPTALPPREVLHMATRAGAAAMGQSDDLGSLELGKKADLVVLDMRRLNTTPWRHDDPHATIVYKADHENVRLTMVDGTILYQDGRYTTLDLTQCMQDAEKAIEGLIRKLD